MINVVPVVVIVDFVIVNIGVGVTDVVVDVVVVAVFVVVVVAVAIVMVVAMFVGLFTEARSSHSPAFQKTVRPTESQNRWKSSEQKEQCVFKIEEKMSPGKRNLNKSFYFQKPQRINLNEMRKSSNDNVGLAFFNLHFLVLL